MEPGFIIRGFIVVDHQFYCINFIYSEGHLPIVKLLVEYGCDVAATGRNGITALHNASE